MTLDKILAISLLSLCSSGMLGAGTVDTRFNGVWIGTETFVTEQFEFQVNFISRTIKDDAVIAIDSRNVGIIRGQYPGRYQLMQAASANNKLTYTPYGKHGSMRTGQLIIREPGRDWGRLVLSADGNTLTESGAGTIAIGRTAQLCSFSGVFHRIH